MPGGNIRRMIIWCIYMLALSTYGVRRKPQGYNDNNRVRRLRD
jgi:hypothetical protein